jgi:hypothetical protein
MVEANYEFEKNFDPPGGSASYLRRQEYWTMLSGATGQLYGSAYTWRMNKGWESNLDTPSVLQLKYMKDLFVNRRWYDLVPDQKHTVMTDGYGVFPCFAGKLSPGIRSYVYLGAPPLLNRILRHAFMAANSCAVAARSLDGSLVLAYMPTIRTITIDMSKLSGSATARWYDPVSGQYDDVKGSPFANAGARQFTPPGANKSGDGDWALVLESQ